MIVYAIIMLLTAALLLIVGRLVYRGKTDLIHDYHRRNVQDLPAYGRAMGRVLMGMGAPPLACGLIALMGKDEKIQGMTTPILLLGFAACCIWLWRVQKKYNGGMF